MELTQTKRQRRKRIRFLSSLPGWSFHMCQVHGGVNETHMTERLGKIADEPFCVDVIFLGEEADVVAEGEEPLKGLLCVGIALHQCVVVGQQNVQGRKAPSPGGKPSTPGSLS